MKSVILSILMCLSAGLILAQTSNQKERTKVREVQVSAMTKVHELIGLKYDYVITDYKITLVNKGYDKVYSWKKGNLSEEQIMQNIQMHKSSETVLFIEEISYRVSGQQADTKMEPVKMKLL